MGAGFEKWLARSSTHRLLRQLLAIERPGHIAGRIEAQNSATRCFNTRGAVVCFFRTRESKDIRQPHLKARCGCLDAARTSSRSIHQSTTYSCSAETAPWPDWVQFSECNDPLSSHELQTSDPQKRKDAASWANALAYLQRRYGLKGVLATWEAMRWANVDLPLEGDHADFLWRTLLNAGFEVAKGGHGERFLEHVWEYTMDLKDRTGRQYGCLYKLFVGQALREMPITAGLWHAKLIREGLGSSKELKQVTSDALIGGRSAFEEFTRIYEAETSRDFYNSCMLEITSNADLAIALHWHQLFIRNNDRPDQATSNHPSIRALTELEKQRSASLGNHLSRPTVGSAANTIREPISHQSSTHVVGSTLADDAHRIRPKELGDEFCAKVFATHAFSISFILRGLELLGVDKLGPVTVRELALRTNSTTEFLDVLSQLRHHRISLVDHPFTKVLLKVVKDGHQSLWNALKNSDVHPGVYSDDITLEVLLRSLLERENHVDAHLIFLAVENACAEGPKRAWNTLLQHYIVTRRYESMSSCLQTMRSKGIPPTARTLTFIHRHILPRRIPGKNITKGNTPRKFDATGFVTQVLVDAAVAGTFVNWRLWREQLKRLGMSHRWKDLERLVHWLLMHYKLKTPPLKPQGDLTAAERIWRYHKFSLLGALFQKHAQASIFVWAFRTASVKDLLRPQVKDINNNDNAKCEPWARGLVLLNTLRKSGMWLDMKFIRQAFVMRMWMLFGPGYSRKPLNNEARLLNKLSLAHYIKHANEVFRNFVWWVPTELLEGDDYSNSRLLVAFFGKVKPINSKTQEYADVTEWAKWLDASDATHFSEGKTFSQRREMWRRSPFRTPNPRLRKFKTPTAQCASNIKSGRTDTFIAANVDATMARITYSPLPLHQQPSAPPLSLHLQSNLQDIQEFS